MERFPQIVLWIQRMPKKTNYFIYHASTYSWSLATGLNNPNIANSIFSFIAAGTYT
ncbi:MAG: hypothetical protein IPI98_09000 [Chitinophagaceae bacterium]|nr:hypothetical protein [Chitinophagaceae bacterium]